MQNRSRLSAREQQVLELLQSGRTNNEIAGALHVTVHTVKFHLASIYRKLGVSNRTQAAISQRAPHPAHAAPGEKGDR